MAWRGAWARRVIAGPQQDGGGPLVAPAEIGDAQLRRMAAGRQAPGERNAGVVRVAGHHASLGQLQLAELLMHHGDRARQPMPGLGGQGEQSGRIERRAPAERAGEHVVNANDLPMVSPEA